MADQFDASIHLSRAAIDGIESLADNRQLIPAIVQAAQSTTPSASIAGLSKKVARQTKTPRRTVEDIFLALFALRGMREDVKDASLVDLITLALKRDASLAWQKEHLAKWIEAAPEVERIVDSITEDNPIAIAQKAHQLCFEHQNVLTFSRLVTDIRPVFDDAGEKVIESIVFHTLILHYLSGRNNHSAIHIALDADDIEDLLKGCQRAQGKMRTIKAEFATNNPVFIPE